MRTLIALLLLAAASCAQTTPASDQDLAAANAKKARGILDQSIKALGGDAYLNIKDMEQHGRGYGFSQNAPTGIGTPYVRFYRYPDKERYEFLKKRDWIIIHNGDKGYEITFRGSREEAATDTATYNRRRHYALDYVLREWLHEPGVGFFYEGTTITGPKNVHQISIRNAQNEGVTLFIDTVSLLPVKKTYTWRDPQYKEMNTEEELYDEYRVYQGIQSPHVVTRIYNGEIQSQRFLDSVTYNAGVKDSLFTPPSTTYNKMKK
jgi:hypothetical protein